MSRSTEPISTRVSASQPAGEKKMSWADMTDDDSLDAPLFASKSAAVSTPAAVAAAAKAPIKSCWKLPENNAQTQSKPTTAAPVSTPIPPPATPAVPAAAASQPAVAKAAAAAPAVAASSWSDLTAKLAAATGTTPVMLPVVSTISPAPAQAPSIPSSTFDPELDSSRDGLPLLLKSLNTTSSSLLAVKEEHEEEASKTRKRKDMQEADDEPVASTTTASSSSTATPSAMTSFLATLSPKLSTTPAWSVANTNAIVKKIAPSAAGTTDASANDKKHEKIPRAQQLPLTGKKQRLDADNHWASNDVPAAAVATAKPTSWLAAVTGEPLAAPAPEAEKEKETETETEKVSKNKVLSKDERARQRQKQIDLGKRTVGYHKYLEAVPLSSRTREHPRTPDIHKSCSKRSFEGQVRKWRRMLHAYDPDAIMQDNDNHNDEQDDEAEEQHSDEEFVMVNQSEAQQQ